MLVVDLRNIWLNPSFQVSSQVFVFRRFVVLYDLEIITHASCTSCNGNSFKDAMSYDFQEREQRNTSRVRPTNYTVCVLKTQTQRLRVDATVLEPENEN